jgi:tetratricopeptide (TPR) repeat protein
VRTIALLTLATLALAPLAPARAQPTGQPATIELSRGVSQSLLHLQEVWLQWISAFYQGDRAGAAEQVKELRSSLQRLGFHRLPELSIAASVRAIEAARQGDRARAEWALDDAEELDPGRPETAFGRAIAAWEGKHYTRAFGQQLVGYSRLLHAEPARALALQDLLLAALAITLLAGGAFVIVQMVAKGNRLYWAIHARLGRLPAAVAHLVAIVLLVWPLFLPAGLLWLLLYWSLLLFGFASLSERLVTALLWVLLGVTPLLLAQQQQRVATLLAPPARAVDALTEGRLYGALFTDLGVLPSMVSDSAAVRQMVGDLHRMLGQWDEAHIQYMQVLEREPNNVPALIDVGAYHFLRGDHGNAVQFFQRAASADPTSAASYYNLSQAYSDAYQFAEQHDALNRARALDEARVNGWIADGGAERIITVNGGLARRDEVMAQLRRAVQGPPSRGVALVRRWLGLGLVAVALGLAFALARVLPRGDAPQAPRLVNRPGWLATVLRVLLPGVPSAEEGNGARAYLAVLVVALVIVLLGGARLVFPVPLGIQPGTAIPTTLACLTLVAFLGGRVWADRH